MNLGVLMIFFLSRQATLVFKESLLQQNWLWWWFWTLWGIQQQPKEQNPAQNEVIHLKFYRLGFSVSLDFSQN